MRAACTTHLILVDLSQTISVPSAWIQLDLLSISQAFYIQTSLIQDFLSCDGSNVTPNQRVKLNIRLF
jgi:hypothetical protein